MARALRGLDRNLFFQVGALSAAGPLDGERTGKNLASRLCRPVEMTLSINDGKVQGRTVRADGSTGNLAGRFTADGAFKGAHGKLEGTFSADTASVIHHTPNPRCPDVRFTLTRAK